MFCKTYRQHHDIHSCDVCTFDKCICSIYNDNILLLLFKMSTYVHTYVCAIVTVACGIQSLIVIGTHSTFSRVSNIDVLVYQYILLMYSINLCGHFYYSLKLSLNKSNFLSLALKIIANASSSQKFDERSDSDIPKRRPLLCVFMNGVIYKM